MKKAVLKNFQSEFRNIHRKTHVLEPLFNKVAGFKACNFIKETPTQEFSYEYCEIFKKTYFEKHLRTAASAQPSVAFHIKQMTDFYRKGNAGLT